VEGWRWDMGVVDKWVEALLHRCEGGRGEEAEGYGRDVEQGVVQGETKEVVVVGGDMEKTALWWM